MNNQDEKIFGQSDAHTYEQTLVQMAWAIRKLKMFLYEFDEVVKEKVEGQGVGQRRMAQMVNGGSAPIRRQVLDTMKERAEDGDEFVADMLRASGYGG
jgi:hypothetical protein